MISELPNGWTLKSIKEICSEISDGNYSSKYPKQNEFLDSGIPFIRANNLVNNTVIWEDMRFISEEKHELLKKGHLKEDDVLITTRGVLGNVAVVPKEFDDANINAQIVRMKTDETIILPEFLLWSLKSNNFKSQLSKKTTGTTLKQLPVKKLEKMLISVPSIETQKKIVEILEKAEKLKEWRAEADELADEYLKSVFLEMFGDPASNQKGWDYSSIGENLKEIRYGVSKPPEFSEEGYPFIRATNIKFGRVINKNLLFINSEEAKKIEKCKLKVHDMIIVRSGANTGDCAVIDPEYFDAYAAYDLILTLNKEKLNPYFLNQLLNLELMVKHLKRLSVRSGQPHLNSKQISTLKIFIPPITLQNQFAQIVQQVETLKTHQTQSKQEIDNLFNTLMQKAFKGELVC